MAEYNRWMNERLYAACAALPDNELREDLGAYFGSILGTLNHGLVGDMIWLQRFSKHQSHFATLEDIRSEPAITQLDKRLHNEFSTLLRARTDLDLVIISLCREFEEADFDTALRYTNTEGRSYRRPFGLLVQHFFNHQTHHRGQITTLLSQRGIDVGVTDLLALIPKL
ncbi:MAG: DinB family protein [Gammaproteobacteria bacterium]